MYNNTSMKIKLYYFCFFVQHFAWLRAASDNMFSSNRDWLLVLQHIYNHNPCSTERWNYFHTLPWLVGKTFFLTELNMYRMHAICSRGMSIVLAVKRSLAILLPCVALSKTSRACWLHLLLFSHSGHCHKEWKFTSGYHSVVSEILLFYY